MKSGRQPDGSFFLDDSESDDQLAEYEDALAKGKSVVYVNKYSEDQARDEHGRWTSEGGGGPSVAKPAAGASEGVNWDAHSSLPSSSAPLAFEATVNGIDMEPAYDKRVTTMREFGMNIPDRSGKHLDQSIEHTVDDYRTQLQVREDNPLMTLLTHDVRGDDGQIRGQQEVQLIAMVTEMGFDQNAVARFARLGEDWNGDWDKPGGRALRAVYEKISGGSVYSGDGKVLAQQEVDRLFTQATSGVNPTQLLNVFKADIAYQQEKAKYAFTKTTDRYGRVLASAVPDEFAAQHYRAVQADAKGVTVFRGIVIPESDLDGMLAEKNFAFGSASAATLSPASASRFALGWSASVSRIASKDRTTSLVAKTPMELRKGEAGVIVKVKVPWERLGATFLGGKGSPDVSEVLVLGDRATMKGSVFGYYRGPSTHLPKEVVKPLKPGK